MRVIRGIKGDSIGPTVATVGNFDGVHLGHQGLLAALNEKSKELGLPSVVVIFEPQPRQYFYQEAAPPRLMRLGDKIRLISEAGIDFVHCLYFGQILAGFSAEEFIEQVLVRRLRTNHLVVGKDFRFGERRKGDIELLRKLGIGHNFTLSCFDTHRHGSERISSTAVRSALAGGHFSNANDLLGHEFFMSGRVAHGDKRGGELGIPTANLFLPKSYMPFTGVYLVTVELEDGQSIAGVANIGYRPTVDGITPLLEAHLFDFDESLYQRRIKVVFKEKIREEKKFASVGALLSQVHKDILEARNRLFSHDNV